MTDLHGEFVTAIRDAGIRIADPDAIRTTGEITRFHIDGDRPGTHNGWCVLFEDQHGAGGAFGSWKDNISGTWRSGRGKLTGAERDRLHTAIEASRRLRDAEMIAREYNARKRALAIWEQAAPPAWPHAYLEGKRVHAYGIRQLDDALVIPMRDTTGTLHSIQFIAQDGTKRFLAGGRKRGCLHLIGDVANEVAIAEGYATSASIHEFTSTSVAVAFDCGNLVAVARALRAAYPMARITVCADNDVRTPGNPGLTHATSAARAIGGCVTAPPTPFNDFNDLAAAMKSRQTLCRLTLDGALRP